MQPLTAAQSALLTGGRLEVSAGCEVLNLALAVTADISNDLVGGSVTWNGDAKIHRACQLTMSTELAWGNVLVRPYMTVSDGVTSARFNCGVFSLTTPERPLGESPVTFSAQGMDRIYLLDREIGATYTVTAGTTYRAALVAVFAAAGLSGYLIDGEAADFTVPTTRTWSLVGSSTDPDQTSSPVTYLRVTNDLLSAVNFRAVWADESGVFRCQRYLPPSVRAPEHTFDADDLSTSIVGESRVSTADIWKQPTRWVFRWTNRPGGMADVEGDGKYTYTLPDADPMSAANRGLVWTTVVDYEAASQAVLTSLGDRRVANDRRVAQVFKVTTGPWPVAGHWDMYTYTDAAAGGTFKVQATDFEFDLLGGDASWSWEVVS